MPVATKSEPLVALDAETETDGSSQNLSSANKNTENSNDSNDTQCDNGIKMKKHTECLVKRMAEIIAYKDEENPGKSYLDTLKSPPYTTIEWTSFISSVYCIISHKYIEKYRRTLPKTLGRHAEKIEALVKDLKKKHQHSDSLRNLFHEISLFENIFQKVTIKDSTAILLSDIANVIVSNGNLSSEDYIAELVGFSYRDEKWYDFVARVIKSSRKDTIKKNSKNIWTNFTRHLKIIKEMSEVLKNRDIHTVRFLLRDIFSKCTEYPENYSSVTVTIDGVNIEKNSMKSLEEGALLDDNVINGVLTLLSLYFKQSNIFGFDTFFVKSLMSPTFSNELKEIWKLLVEEHPIWKYAAWLMPVHLSRAKHWSLFVVLPTQKKFLYLDSLHYKCPPILIQRTCQFMAMFADYEIDWREWTLYTPFDVPLQSEVHGSVNNCGVHLCCWSFLIFSGTTTAFHEKIMYNVRKNIAHLLCEYKSSGCILRLSEDGKKKNAQNTKINLNEDFTEIDVSNIIKRSNRDIPDVSLNSTFDFCGSLASKFK